MVALTNLSKGKQFLIMDENIMLQENIPAKHKFFTKDMNAGDEVIMYGVLVGKAQNVYSAREADDYCQCKACSRSICLQRLKYEWKAPDVSKFKDRTFNGYHRADGRVGTANYWLFIPTVFCENRNLDVIREALHNELGYAVTDKYKQYTHQLMEAYKKGEDIEQVDLSTSASINRHNKRGFSKM